MEGCLGIDQQNIGKTEDPHILVASIGTCNAVDSCGYIYFPVVPGETHSLQHIDPGNQIPIFGDITFVKDGYFFPDRIAGCIEGRGQIVGGYKPSPTKLSPYSLCLCKLTVGKPALTRNLGGDDFKQGLLAELLFGSEKLVEIGIEIKGSVVDDVIRYRSYRQPSPPGTSAPWPVNPLAAQRVARPYSLAGTGFRQVWVWLLSGRFQ